MTAGVTTAFCSSLSSVQEMHALAGKVAKMITPGALIGLSGPLGAGKTEFVRGFARALGIGDEISSPTFVLETVYDIPIMAFDSEGPAELHHWDLYRLRSPEFECELADYRGDESKISLVEWPERIPWIDDLLDLRILIGFFDPGPPLPEQRQAPFNDPGLRNVEILQYREGVLKGGL